MSSILKTNALIRSIRLRGFIPESQRTFEAQDFLDIATEKINIGLMKEIITARGDYLVYYEDIPLQEGIQGYSIPDRAHGDKLRDAAIVDSDGRTKRELTQITLEELTDYRYDYQSIGYSISEPFYMQNNQLILINKNINSGDCLRMYFYMRPNKLVTEQRAMTAISVNSTIEVDTVNPKSGSITSISLTGVIESVDHGLTSGQKIIIAGTDSVPALDGNYTVTYLTKDTFSVGVIPTQAGTEGSYNLAAEVVTIPSVNFPKHFTSNLLYDVVTHKSPNNIKIYNIPSNSVNNASKTISFRISDVTKSGVIQILKGDYITSSEETIVPNVPTEYHPVVAQMVAVHCMESMADEQQKKSAENTLEKMMDQVLSIVQNRVEGAPKKIKNRNGTLSQSVNRGRFFRKSRG